MKRVLLIATLALMLPAAVSADTVDFSFIGGTLTAPVTGPLSGLSTLIGVTVLPGGTPILGSLGTVAFETGSLTSGTLAAGGTFGAGGFVTITATGFGVIYTGVFSGPTTWTPNGTASYTLTGPLSGAISAAAAGILFPGCTTCDATNLGALTTLTITGSYPFSSPASISSGNINTNVAPVPEPATLSLFGAGLLGLGGVIRRRLKQ